MLSLNDVTKAAMQAIAAQQMVEQAGDGATLAGPHG
jgi:hypothetical protein